MPWSPKDAKRHTKKAKSSRKQRQWAHVADKVLEESGDEGRAIREANAAVSHTKSFSKAENDEGPHGTGTYASGYAPPSDGPFRCSNCRHFTPVNAGDVGANSSGNCDEDEVVNDPQVKGKVQAGACCSFFRTKNGTAKSLSAAERLVAIASDNLNKNIANRMLAIQKEKVRPFIRKYRGRQNKNSVGGFRRRRFIGTADQVAGEPQ